MAMFGTFIISLTCLIHFMWIVIMKYIEDNVIKYEDMIHL